MLAKEPYDAGVEVAVKGCPVEARRVGAKAWQAGGKLLRALRQEREVASRHDMKLGLARQGIQDPRNALRINAPIAGS
jgi:hypothetical protein